MHDAATAADILPVLLNEIILSAKAYVRKRTVRGGIRGAKVPGALVSVLITSAIVPRISHRVRRGFLDLMGEDAHFAICARIIIGRSRTISA